MPGVVAVVLCQPARTCWAKSKPSTSHSLRLLLHPRDWEGTRVQPIVYVGSGFLSQPVECVLAPGAVPRIPSAIALPEARPTLLARLSEQPATTLHLLFFCKTSVKIARNHIWRPKPASPALPEPFQSAMAGGRAGRIPR